MHLMVDTEDVYPETEEEERERFHQLWSETMHDTVLAWFATHEAEVDGKRAFPTFITKCDIGNTEGRDHQQFIEYLEDRIVWLKSMQETWYETVFDYPNLVPIEDGCDFS